MPTRWILRKAPSSPIGANLFLLDLLDDEPVAARRDRTLEAVLAGVGLLLGGELGELLELVEHRRVDLRAELAVLVEDEGEAAAHARREVAARAAEDDHATAGHVLAAVIAHALDDGDRPGVAHGEALTGQPAEERASARGAVEDG